MPRRPILSLDFDGVIHDYKNGWQDGEIYGEPTPGFFEWAEQAAMLFTLIIHTSRAKSAEGGQAVLQWIADKAAEAGRPAAAGLFQVTAAKPPAFITIDDRCIRFNGDWNDPDYYPPQLIRFKPWMNSGDKP